MRLPIGWAFGRACAASTCVLAAGCGTPMGATGAPEGGGGWREAGTPEATPGGPEGDGGWSETGTPPVPKCGSTPTLLANWVSEVQVPNAVSGSWYVASLATNATDVYLLFWGSGPLGSASDRGYLMRVPVGGGSAVLMAHIPAENSQGPQAMAATSTAVVFAAGDGDAGTLVRVPADGGAASILATTNGPVTALVADEENAYFVDLEATKSVPLTGGPARTLVAAVSDTLGIVGTTLYLTDIAGTVSSVPTGGGKVTVVAKDQAGAAFPMACGPDLCWINDYKPGALMQLAPGGGAPRVLATDVSGTGDVVFDGRNFFLVSDVFLQRIPATGGAPILAGGGPDLTRVALGPTCLYWSSSRGLFSVALTAADVADVAADSGLIP